MNGMTDLKYDLGALWLLSRTCWLIRGCLVALRFVLDSC